jgi:hypothetical protein
MISPHSSWNELNREFDLWEQQGRTVDLWWRDDDAEQPAHALGRLIHLSATHGVPITIAVSPALADATLGSAVAGEFRCTVLQHGYAHLNHAPDGQKKNELSDFRPLRLIESELRRGIAQMKSLFGKHFLPVMVPPWNRIADGVLARLGGIGFTGVSGYLARNSSPDHGLVRCNTHVDIVNWRERDRFVGTERALQLLTEHLAARRTRRADAKEPTGLLTHHLRHDADAWAFIDQLLAFSTRHHAVRWRSATEIFSSPSSTRAP